MYILCVTPTDFSHTYKTQATLRIKLQSLKPQAFARRGKGLVAFMGQFGVCADARRHLGALGQRQGLQRWRQGVRNGGDEFSDAPVSVCDN